MSRIGRMTVTVPAGVTVDYKDKVVTVKGPKGTLSQFINDRNIDVVQDAGVLTVERHSETKDTRSKHGLYRQLINNMVQGVVTPFSKTLIIKGVGFKVAVTGNKLVMNIGYSHTVEVFSPEGITFTCPDLTTVVVTGINKELVGGIAASIKSKRPVEPYHNYGIHYSDEVLVKKEGKTAGK